MQDLHLVGFTKDHRHLIFSIRKDAKSGDFVVPVDDDLLDAVDEVASHRADTADMVEPVVETAPERPRIEAQLSVREVQARLRAGDRVAAIAADAGVDIAWVERFAPPVRAEQRRVVDRALTVPLTRPRAGSSAVPLRRAIAAAMADRGVDLTAEAFETAWSARLVGDSKWMIGFEFPNRGRTRRLEWKFDVGSGELTTKDRFASQLAFVDSDEDLPPADVTVGSVPVHSGGGLARGSVTSGGLARPGSSRVTLPSRSATPLPETVRRPPTGSASGSPTRPRPPLPTVHPTPRPTVDPPEAPRPATAMPTQPSRPESAPVTREPKPMASGRASEPTAPTPVATPGDELAAPPERRGPTAAGPRPAPVSGPRPADTTQRRSDQGPRRSDPAPRPVEGTIDQPLLVPKPVDRRAGSAPVSGRSTPPVVPPRRPAPVAPPTNASMANTRRPVPEIAPRLLVVIDDDAGESASLRRRPAMIEDRRALDDAVPSQPPTSGADSVVILRAVDDPEDVSGRVADEDLESIEETNAAVEDEWDDDVEDEWDDGDVADESDVEPIEDETEDVGEDELSDVDDSGEVDDEQWVDEAADDESVDEDVDEECVDDDDVDRDGLDEDDGDEDWVEEADEFDDESESAADDELETADDDVENEAPPLRPVRATLRPGRSAPRRAVARRQLTAAEAALPDEDEPPRDDDDEMVDDSAASPAPQRRSSVQFRPGAATQAGSGRAEPSANGRVPDPDPSADDETDTAAETPLVPRRRRRRTEPLRAR